MSAAFEFKNAERTINRMIALARQIPNEVARALYEEALIEAAESQRRTPVDTGALRASHDVSRPIVTSTDISVTIRVGGASAPYAIIVHEDLEAFHRVGQARFLASTVMESAPFLSARIAKRIQLNRQAAA